MQLKQQIYSNLYLPMFTIVIFYLFAVQFKQYDLSIDLVIEFRLMLIALK